jgi:tetratricopeptide (TPR) repeat protein
MKRILLSTLTATLLGGGLLYANTQAPATVKEINAKAVSNVTNQAKNHPQKLVQEALFSLKEAHEALLALDKGKSEDARKKLESALGKLEGILALKESPKLLPIDNIIEVHEYIGTPEQIQAQLKEAVVLLKKHQVQEARAILMPLESEIDITVVSLPLVTYPDALKLALKYLHAGENAKAKEVLLTALSTFSRVTEVLPIPLLRATDLIASASEIAKKDKAQALKYLDGADESLKMAELLGYVSRSTTTYKALHEALNSVKKEVAGENKAEKIFAHLSEMLKEFKSKIFSQSDNTK